MATNLAEVGAYIAQLAPAVGGCKKAVDESALRFHHSRSEFADMLSEIKMRMSVPAKLRLGLVKSGGPADAAAWIALPQPFPLLSTQEFRGSTFTIHVRKSALASTSFEGACYVFSHELSHLIIEGICHPLRKNERAVDLLAMILGFAEISGRVAEMDSLVGTQYHGVMSGISDLLPHHRHGYLTPAERAFARDMIVRMR